MKKLTLLIVIILFALAWQGCSEKNKPKANVHSSLGNGADSNFFVGKMRAINEDGTKWYYDNNTTKLVNRNSMHFYLGKKATGSPWIRFRNQYYGETDLELKGVEVRTDKNSYMIYPEGTPSEGQKDGFNWSWFDKAADADLIAMAMDVQTSKVVLVRQHGSSFYSERSLTAEETQGITNVLGAYKELGGQWQ